MKVLVVCMVTLAVALAMPVAEDNVAAPATAEVKPENLSAEKPQADAALASPVKSESPVVPEKKEEPLLIVTPSSGLLKSADIVPKAAIPAPVTEVQAEAAASNEQSKPEGKKPDETISNEKPQDEKAKELKPAEKETESKPEDIKPKERSDLTSASVTEESSKVIIAEPSIDVVSAVKTPAAIADDVVDPAALIPTSDQKIEKPIVVAAEEKDETFEISTEKKPEEAKPEQKSADLPAEIPTKPVSDVKSAVAADAKPEKPVDQTVDDSLRVVRDTVDDQKAAASSELAKPETPAVSEQKAASELPEASPSKTDNDKKDESVIANDSEKTKLQERSNAVSKSDKPEADKPESEEATISTEKSVVASVSSSNASPKSVAETAVIDELKPKSAEVKPDNKEVKPDNKESEKPSGDAPGKGSSEESSENSDEKKTESKESSEEESTEVTKAPAKSR